MSGSAPPPVRRQRRVGGEARQQLVVEDFHSRSGEWAICTSSERSFSAADPLIGQAGAQAQDVVLQGMQQAVVVQVLVFGIQAEF